MLKAILTNSLNGEMFKRGFKSFSENLASFYRKQLKMKSDAPISVHSLSEYLNVALLIPEKIPGLSPKAINTLTNSEANFWSAVTLSRGNEHIIIYNPSHSPARQVNDIMHELSHVILEHKPQTLHSYEAGTFLRHFDDNQEDEANWLAAAILLPKDALFKIKKARLSNRVAAKEYCVSEQLVRMRLNTSGVNRVFENTRKKYKN
jgi:Zn-dependent peptidase ImmA (M78 family)